MSMRQEIEQNFAVLETAKETIYQTIADLPQEVLTKKPAADQWSGRPDRESRERQDHRPRGLHAAAPQRPDRADLLH